jgi:hypothetical protein
MAMMVAAVLSSVLAPAAKAVPARILDRIRMALTFNTAPFLYLQCGTWYRKNAAQRCGRDFCVREGPAGEDAGATPSSASMIE